MPKTHRIALTGGPCGGKSTALPLLADHFKSDFHVFTVPELATLFHMSGVDLRNDNLRVLESAIFDVQHQMESSFEELARKRDDKDSIIIVDRGLSDLEAYCPPETWNEIVSHRGYHPETLRKHRYGIVLHFTTAAIGAEAHFTNENNPARQCTVELAKTLDRKSFNVWSDHPNRVELDNSTDMSGKVLRAKEAIDRWLKGSS